MLVTGVAALSYANSLERAARPPFVMAGVLLAGIAVSFAHPIWSALRRTPPQQKLRTNNTLLVGCAGRHEICVVKSAELSTLVLLESR